MVQHHDQSARLARLLQAVVLLVVDFLFCCVHLVNRAVARTLRLCRVVLLTSFVWTFPNFVRATDNSLEPKQKNESVQVAGQLQARFTDDSNLKLTLLDKQIQFTTPYGELVVRVADVQRIEFATRVSDEMTKQIETEISKLGSAQFQERDSATAKLLRFREKAYPALREAVKHENLEVASRARRLLTKLREDLRAEWLDGREHDVIYTADSRIAGRIVAKTLKVLTTQFDEQLVKLPDLRSLLPASAADDAVPNSNNATRSSVEPKKEDESTQVPGQLLASFTDNSILKLTLLNRQIQFKTAFGELVIPVTDIHRIEFATRVSDEEAKQIASEISNLAHPEFQERDSAAAKLLWFREKAYAALLQAAKHKSVEVASRAKRLLTKLRDDIPAEMLDGRENDVIYTADSRIAGRVVAESLKVKTVQFGEQQVKLPDLRSLKTASAIEELIPKNVMPGPVNLTNYLGQVGKKLFFNVTGNAGGGVLWGSDKYTLDSTLAMAVVHTGVLKPGKSGVVCVTILGPQAFFQASVRNGIASHAYGMYQGAYQVSKVRR